MTTNAGLIGRYQDYRTKRWLLQEQRMAGMLPGWRTRSRRRVLAVTVAATIAALYVASLLCIMDLRWASIVVALAALLFLPAWTMLRIASQGQDFASADVLDEREIAQRNSARSVGLAITQWTTLIPLIYLLLAGTAAPEINAFRTAFAGGVMMLAALLTGGCAPAMILGWQQPDPEPES